MTYSVDYWLMIRSEFGYGGIPPSLQESMASPTPP